MLEINWLQVWTQLPITVKDEKEKINLWKYYQMDRSAPCKYLILVESDKTIVKIY